MRTNKRPLTFLHQHFRKSGHSYRDITIQPLEQLVFDTTATTGFKIQARHLAELKWTTKLQTAHPLGLNDNIHRVGNISNTPDIDIFNI